MANGSATIEEVARWVAASQYPAWTRAVLSREGDTWVARYMEPIVGPKPERWESEDWSYRDLAFVAAEVEPGALSAVLRAEGTVLDLGQYHPALPGFQATANWTDRSSKNPHEPTPLSGQLGTSLCTRRLQSSGSRRRGT